MTTVEPGQTVRLNTGAVAWREVDGETIALVLSSSKYLRLSRKATVLWRSLVEGTTRDELVEQLVATYDLNSFSAGQEVQEFLSLCESRGLLQQGPASSTVMDSRLLGQPSAWNPSRFLASGSSASALAAAQEFAASHKGLVGGLEGAKLAAVLDELERVRELAHDAIALARLRCLNDERDARARRLLGELLGRTAEVDKTVLFFAVEWADLAPEECLHKLADACVERHRRYLVMLTRRRRHVLAEQAEEVMLAKERSGIGAWRRLFADHRSRIRVGVENQPVELDQALALLERPDREIRRAAAEKLGTALGEQNRVPLFALQAVIVDKAVDDELRGYADWLASTRVAGDLDEAMIPSLLGTVEAHYGIAQRYWRLKAGALGHGRLSYDCDRLAPLGPTVDLIPWEKASAMVGEALSAFSLELGCVAKSLLDEGSVRAVIAPEKVPQGFTIDGPAGDPYVSVTYSGTLRSVLTLAHEIGHGAQRILSRGQGGLCGTELPQAMDDAAGLFAEMVVLRHLAISEVDPRRRLRVLGVLLDSAVSMVFRHVAMMRFEEAVHVAWRADRTLTAKGVAQLWLASLRPMVGDAVDLPERAGWEWVQVPHPVHDPGGAYAHTFSYLVAQRMYDRWKDHGTDAVPGILAFLSSGGSRSPNELLELVGLDLSAPDVWTPALDGLERVVAEAEELVG